MGEARGHKLLLLCTDQNLLKTEPNLSGVPASSSGSTRKREARQQQTQKLIGVYPNLNTRIPVF
jgi:hypothetical protein